MHFFDLQSIVMILHLNNVCAQTHMQFKLETARCPMIEQRPCQLLKAKLLQNVNCKQTVEKVAQILESMQSKRDKFDVRLCICLIV